MDSYPNENRPNGVSDKEVFLKRTLNKWFSGKYIEYIKTKEKSPTLYNILIERKAYAYISSISYKKHFFSTNIIINLKDATSSFCSYTDNLFSESEVYNFEYKLITKSKYDAIKNLFVDDRDIQEFEFTTFTNNRELIKSTIKLKGKTREKAKKSYKGNDLIIVDKKI